MQDSVLPIDVDSYYYMVLPTKLRDNQNFVLKNTGV